MSPQRPLLCLIPADLLHSLRLWPRRPHEQCQRGQDSCRLLLLAQALRNSGGPTLSACARCSLPLLHTLSPPSSTLLCARRLTDCFTRPPLSSGFRLDSTKGDGGVGSPERDRGVRGLPLVLLTAGLGVGNGCVSLPEATALWRTFSYILRLPQFW